MHPFLTLCHWDLPAASANATRADARHGGAIHDDDRIAFIAAHFDATRRGIAAGANVKGYFYWSLLDNFEWAFGCKKRFSLVHVDFTSLKRTPKASYHAFARSLAKAPAV